MVLHIVPGQCHGMSLGRMVMTPWLTPGNANVAFGSLARGWRCVSLLKPVGVNADAGVAIITHGH